MLSLPAKLFWAWCNLLRTAWAATPNCWSTTRKPAKVYSVNAEGTAPKLATIEWYKIHNGGKLPVDHSLLAGTVPGVVDAWYILLSRWGTKSFADVLTPAIELAERGVPIGGGLNSPA